MNYEFYQSRKMAISIFYTQPKKMEIRQTKKDKKRMRFLKIIDLINKNRLLIAAKTK